MKNLGFKILENVPLTESVWRMRLGGDTKGIKPGQFVNIKIPGQFLRRPISVCDAEEGVLTIIYKVVGEGTDKMSQMAVGTELDVLTCLGNGYNMEKAGPSPLLVGGGVGVPPLYALAKRLTAQGKTVSVVLGFNTEAEVFYEQEFRALGCEVVVTTVDGSYGTKGFVTAAIDGRQSYYYACGPLPMLKALIAHTGTNGEVSMEERMGCGFGACVGCTIETTEGYKKVCKDGPVFESSTLGY